MKKIVFIITLFILNTINAQIEFEIPIKKQITSIIKTEKKTKLSFLVNDKVGGFFVIKKSNKGYTINYYNKDLELLNKHDLVLNKDKNASIIISAFLNEKGLNLIERFKNFKDNSIEYFVNTTSLNNYNFNKIKLLSIPYKEIKRPTNIVSSKEDGELFGNFIITKNCNYFTIYFDLNDNKIERQRFYTFNKTFKNIYQTDFSRKVKDRKFVTQNTAIDELDGSVYLLGKVFTKDRRKNKKGKKYQYEVSKINKNINNTLIIDTQANNIESLKIINNKNKLACIGFYSEKINTYNGIALYRINNKSLSLISEKYIPFSKQILKDKYGTNKFKEIKNLTIRKTFFTPEDEIIINAEEYYINQESIGSGLGVKSISFSYMDIASFKINNKDELIWAKNINKYQVGSFKDKYDSFISWLYKGNNYFIFNTSIVDKKSNGTIEFKSKGIHKHNLYITSLNNKEIRYSKLYDKEETQVSFNIFQAKVGDDKKSIILIGSEGNKERLLKLTIK